MATAEPRSRVLFNATVRTLDQADTVAEAVAIDERRIVAIGESAEILARFPQAEQRDLRGATVLPGLIDSHLHLLTLGLNSFAVDLSRARSITDVLFALRERGAETSVEDWVLSSSRWHE